MVRHISHGADVEQLDDIAVGLRRQGEKLADVGGRGAVLLEKLRVEWDGPDFEKFATRWRLAHRHIDEAEASLRTYSRKLLAESDSQRNTSGLSSGGGRGGSGTGGGSGGGGHETGGHGGDGNDSAGTDTGRNGGVGVGFAPAVPGPRTHLAVCPSPFGPEMVYQITPDAPQHRVAVCETPFLGELTPVIPSLPGGEDVTVPDPSQPGLQHPQPWVDGGEVAPFDRDQQWARGQAAPEHSASPATGAASPSGADTSSADGAASSTTGGAGASSAEAPTQVPTSEGGHLTTASDSAGQRSVAFNPLFEVLSGGFAANGSQMGGWLGGEADLQPWNR